MDGILITIIVITAFLVYKMISSSRKQEGYKRWKATSSGKEEKTTKVKWEHGAWLRHALGGTVPRAQYVQKFDESAVVWCANLLGVETARLKEILRDVSEHYREFWMRKRKGGYRMISAPDKELQSIQTTINSRILSSVTMIHPAAVGFRSGHSVVDNASPHLGKRYILKMDIHDFFFSLGVARTLNKWMFSGTALSGARNGVFVKTKPDVECTNALTFADIVSLESTVMDAGVDVTDGTAAYVCTPKVYGALKSTPKAAGAAEMICQNGMVNGYPVLVTNYMDADSIGFGVFSNAAIGQFGDMDLVIDPYTGAKSNIVNFVLNTDYDIVVARPEAFAIAKKKASA